MKDDQKEDLIYWLIACAFVFLAVQALCNVEGAFTNCAQRINDEENTQTKGE